MWQQAKLHVIQMDTFPGHYCQNVFCTCRQALRAGRRAGPDPRDSPTDWNKLGVFLRTKMMSQQRKEWNSTAALHTATKGHGARWKAVHDNKTNCKTKQARADEFKRRSFRVHHELQEVARYSSYWWPYPCGFLGNTSTSQLTLKHITEWEANQTAIQTNWVESWIEIDCESLRFRSDLSVSRTVFFWGWGVFFFYFFLVWGSPVYNICKKIWQHIPYSGDCYTLLKWSNNTDVPNSSSMYILINIKIVLKKG